MLMLPLVIAGKEIQDHLRDWRSLVSAALFALMGPGVVLLVSMSDRATGKGAAVTLGMLSVFALVSAFAGAIDIALDSTAGERERRSLVPLLLNPVSGSEIVIGKWIAVVAFALASLALNGLGTILVLALASPSVLIWRGPQLALWMTLGLVPLALLGAAVNLLVAVMCRTTKEAHGALRFLAFVPMLIGMFLVFFPTGSSRLWMVLPIVGQQALIGAAPHIVPIGESLVLAVLTLASAVPALWGATQIVNGVRCS
jgi:sodium transport system permease protein